MYIHILCVQAGKTGVYTFVQASELSLLRTLVKSA